MKLITSAFCILVTCPIFAQQAEDFYDPTAMAAARDNLGQMHGDSLNTLFITERLENQRTNGNNNLVWEAQGWVGKDLNKLWLKTEGESDADEAEFQALFSHAISPFWDIQAGLRHDSLKNASRDYAVIGFMGLAPYWFELDAAAFISDEGNTSARLEAEYELRFTQRLILQPRMELNYAFSDDLEAGIGQGMHKASFGLRLRYEFRREISPYLGVEWKKSFGDTANLLRAASENVNETTFIMGLRVWY